MEPKNIPISNSFLYELEEQYNNGKTVKIKCPFCEKYHIHGSAEGWRSSHCQKGEYFIKNFIKKQK